MRREFQRAIVLVAALLALSGCSGFSGLAQPTPTPNPSANPAAMAAKEAIHPDPNFDFGYTVQITTAGVHPAWLVADCCQAVTWKNLTHQPVSVVLDHLTVSSGTILPGATWVYTPTHVQSITYHIDGQPDLHGAIQVNQTFES